MASTLDLIQADLDDALMADVSSSSSASEAGANNTDTGTNDTATMTLLERTQAIMKLEKSLTESLEAMQPWLVSETQNPTHTRSRVRPIPQDLAQATAVLAVARTWSARTSAPAGWSSAAPVAGFSTPNPLPHQLRGGALAALQLEQAQQQRTAKRQRLEEAQQEEIAAQQQEMAETLSEKTDTEPDPKRRDVVHHDRQQHQQQQRRPAAVAPVAPLVKKSEVSMNLSDSSSSDDEDDD